MTDVEPINLAAATQPRGSWPWILPMLAGFGLMAGGLLTPLSHPLAPSGPWPWMMLLGAVVMVLAMGLGVRADLRRTAWVRDHCAHDHTTTTVTCDDCGKTLGGDGQHGE